MQEETSKRTTEGEMQNKIKKEEILKKNKNKRKEETGRLTCFDQSE